MSHWSALSAPAGAEKIHRHEFIILPEVVAVVFQSDRFIGDRVQIGIRTIGDEDRRPGGKLRWLDGRDGDGVQTLLEIGH